MEQPLPLRITPNHSEHSLKFPDLPELGHITMLALPNGQYKLLCLLLVQ